VVQASDHPWLRSGGFAWLYAVSRAQWQEGALPQGKLWIRSNFAVLIHKALGDSRVNLANSHLPLERSAMPQPIPSAAPSYPSPMPEGFGFAAIRHRSALPLTGITVLAVEDSRFASEALRLLCQRSGARLRRAETLSAARRHLSVYRPDVVLDDLGLPDGNGVDLIRELVKNNQCQSVVLAISGDPDGWSAAVRAGAAGFVEKPLESLTGFQQMILGHLTGQPQALLPFEGKPIHPDVQALQDDLVHAAELIENGDSRGDHYVADFVRGVARSCHDAALEGAAVEACSSPKGVAELGRALATRISGAVDPFANPTEQETGDRLQAACRSLPS
jgi:CheY-like chemotaxis protein